MYNSLKTTVAKIELNNPLIAASGIVSYGKEFSQLVQLKNFGAIATKGTTQKPNLGNECPRIAETPSGMLNSIGLENPGIDYFIKHQLPWLSTQNTKIIANIAGSTVSEYEALTEQLDKTNVDFIELNISCPNVKCGGASFGSSTKLAFEVVNKARKKTNKPIIAKLTPNVQSIADIAKAVESAGADAVTLINTILAMKIDINTKRPILKNNFGGLSGPAILPIAIRMIWQTFNAIKIPIIGCGGVNSTNDVIEMMLAGACAIQIGTALFTNPKIVLKISEKLQNWLTTHNLKSVKELIGQVRIWQ